jgi:hypothetical protein
MKKISHKGYRFPLEIIQQAIWLYVRFTLSFRDVEDLLAERGIIVSYETVRRWVNHFGPMIAANLRKRWMKRDLSARAKLAAKNVTHWKRIALACSPSATYARARSSASLPPLERARRSCRRFMPIWPGAVAPPRLLLRSRELNARRMCARQNHP